MKLTISLISATLLTGALATFAFAQAPAAPTSDAPPTAQQEAIAHRKAAIEAEVMTHHKVAIVAHHRAAMMAHQREEMMAHHKAMMEKEQAMHANPPAPAN